MFNIAKKKIRRVDFFFFKVTNNFHILQKDYKMRFFTRELTLTLKYPLLTFSVHFLGSYLKQIATGNYKNVYTNTKGTGYDWKLFFNVLSI